MGRSEVLSQKDHIDFEKIRQHVQRVKDGTRCLLRTAAPGKPEARSVCVFYISADLRSLEWREGGDGTLNELPFESIVRIEAEQLDGEKMDTHYVLSLTISSAGAVSLMELTFRNADEYESWCEVLKFCTSPEAKAYGKVFAKPTASDSAASGARYWTVRPQAGAGASVSQSVPASPAAGAAGMGAAGTRRLHQQEQEIKALKEENERLKESAEQNEALTARLLQDVARMEKAQQFIMASDRHGKTASSSRESDEHLRDREMAILRRENIKLKKQLKEKQQTIKELLQMVGRLNAQLSAGESSAAEEEEKDDSSAQGEDEPVRSAGRSAGAAAQSKREEADANALAALNASGAALAAVSEGGEEDAEIQELANKLAMLEGMVSGLGLGDASGGVPAFQPPPRTIRGGGGAAAATAAAAKAQPKPQAQPKRQAATSPPSSPAPNARALGAMRAAQAAMAGGQAAASKPVSHADLIGDTTGLGPRSIAALEVLAKEMAALESKKQVVAGLLQEREPESEDDDDEDDDGFPLR
eukprot:TRINITY_DN10894_c0_g1_i1.p1 TRINITY_DN10894_c0_g1~~TRINITY_DN10894_c0_g1_i1.p1  ORF type:complete len:563 (-),score=159.59 TRINITY_DN10894_c0_g1_i1:107-1696(-)